MIKMIGRFEFDWRENTLHIPPRHETGEINLASNLMFIKNIPYLNLRINNLEFTGFLDSGSNHFLNLTPPYCNSNNQLIKLEDQKQVHTRTGFTGAETRIERRKVKNPQIYFDGRKINNSSLDNEVYSANCWYDIKCIDGEVGVEFIKKIGSKCILDFDTMLVKIED